MAFGLNGASFFLLIGPLVGLPPSGLRRAAAAFRGPEDAGLPLEGRIGFGRGVREWSAILAPA